MKGNQEATWDALGGDFDYAKVPKDQLVECIGGEEG